MRGIKRGTKNFNGCLGKKKNGKKVLVREQQFIFVFRLPNYDYEESKSHAQNVLFYKDCYVITQGT